MTTTNHDHVAAETHESEDGHRSHGSAHKDSSMNKKSRAATILPIVGYVAAGALLGSAVTLLFAPTSGPDLRKKIARGASNMAQDVRSHFTNGHGAGPAKLDKAEKAGKAMSA